MEETSNCHSDFCRSDRQGTGLQWNFSVHLIVLTADLDRPDSLIAPSFRTYSTLLDVSRPRPFYIMVNVNTA